MNALATDLRYALRQLSRAPGFAAVAVLTLAIGIGANTALFSFGNAVLARPLPWIQHAERLVWVAPVGTSGGNAFAMSYPDFTDYRALRDVFTDAAAIGDARFSVSPADSAGAGEPARVRGQFVSSSFFTILGVRMAFGRTFLPDEDRTQGTHPVAVIGYRFWQEHFNGQPDVIGRVVTINGRSYTIVGVTPERFNGIDHAERRDVWVPIAMAGTSAQSLQGLLQQRGTWWLQAIARLQPGVALQAANTAVAMQLARIAKADSAGHAFMTARVFPVRSGLTPNDMKDIYPVASLATTVTFLVLLIACANVSNLLLGRAVARRREIAVRLSLGAARRRILRQLLTESVLLATLGTAVGFVFASWSTDIMATIIPAPLDVTPDAHVLWFTIAAAFVTGVGFGIVPAFHATRADVTVALKDATIGFDRRRSRLQGSFVVAQISLSLVLLVMAGMFLSGLYKSNRIDVRFEATNRVLAASFDLGLQGYTTERADAFLSQLRERAAVLPGVEGVTITNQVPMSERLIGADVAVEGEEPGRPRRFGENAGMEVYQSDIRPNYFHVLGIPLMQGRDFTDADRRDTPPVVIVSESFARRVWGDTSMIGKRVSVNGVRGPFATVVGVAREALTMGVTDRHRPIIYVAQRQNAGVHDLTILVRTNGNSANLAKPVRDILRQLDAALPVYDVQTLERYRHDRSSEARLGSSLLAIFGSLALLLATVGVYAVTAFSVGQRTREVGVRVALGAAQQQIVRLFLWEGIRLSLIGVVVGLVLAAAAAKILSAVFFGLSAADAMTFAAGAFILLAAGMAASAIPAWRAARADPIRALRAE